MGNVLRPFCPGPCGAPVAGIQQHFRCSTRGEAQQAIPEHRTLDQLSLQAGDRIVVPERPGRQASPVEITRKIAAVA
jgi:hypothetical protein